MMEGRAGITRRELLRGAVAAPSGTGEVSDEAHPAPGGECVEDAGPSVDEARMKRVLDSMNDLSGIYES